MMSTLAQQFSPVSSTHSASFHISQVEPFHSMRFLTSEAAKEFPVRADRYGLQQITKFGV